MAVASRSICTLASLAVLALASACGSTDSARVEVVTIGNADDPFESGIRLSLAGQLSRAATREGLVALDDRGRVVPSLADRWIVTDDGKSYIFRLRDGHWRDGTEITSRSAVIALRRAQRALRQTSLGIDLRGIEEIREMAGRVVEIRLDRPMPHFLQILAQPELGLEKGGAGAGPMRLERQEDTAVLDLMRPEERGLPMIENWQDRVRSIALASANGEEAVDRFNDGRADLVLGGRIGDFPRTASVGILRGTIQLDPATGLFGLEVLSRRGFLSEPTNREALAMAIDREALIDQFSLDGWVAATTIVPVGLQEGVAPLNERWAEITIEERRAMAASRVAAWRSGQEQAVDLQISVWFPQGPGSDMLFASLKKDLGSIGVTLVRAEPDDKGDLRLVETVARYPDPAWFLNRFSCKVRKGLCDREADAKLTEAWQAQDPVQRAQLVAEAHEILTQTNLFIPFGSPIRWSLVRGDVLGFSTNRWAWHPLMPMAMLPK